MNQEYPIRILHVIGVMNRGGAESMIMNLYRQIDRSKIQFDFVEHTNMQAVFDEEILSLGGRIYHCPRFTGKNYYTYKKWWKRFFQTDGSTYQIVHGHIGSTAAIYLKEAKKNGSFAIAHSHSAGTDNSLKSYLYRILSFPTRFIADYFFACSKEAGIERYGKKNYYSSNFVLFKNGIDTNKYVYNKEIRNLMRDKYNISNEIVIGHVGRFVVAKNHEFILDIFCEFLKRVKDSKLILIGDGPLRNKIESKAKNLGIFDNIIFTGSIPNVNKYLQMIDVFLFPSIYEGLPFALVEAQAAGLPCIISDSIPRECNIVNDLVISLSLKASITEWINRILNVSKQINRVDTSKIICDSGYDIKETTKWLEEFYIDKYRY